MPHGIWTIHALDEHRPDQAKAERDGIREALTRKVVPVDPFHKDDPEDEIEAASPGSGPA
jgi:hypothetical protein